MRLSEKQKSILAVAELRAHVPLKELRHLTGYREHTIRYVLKRLYEERIIGRRRPIIDMNQLGFTHYTFLFSLMSEKQAVKRKLFEYLIKSSHVTWVFELGGDYQYGVSISVRHLTQVRDFLDELSVKFGNIFFDRTYSIQLSFTYFGRRYLSKNPRPNTPFTFKIAESAVTIDDTDRQILSSMANVEYETITELCHKLYIPLPTFERRRKRLEEQNIIKGYFYWLNAESFDMHPYTILIYSRVSGANFRERLYNFAKHELSTVYFIECMGDWSFELGVEVSEAKELTTITQKLYDHFGQDMKTLKVVPILNYLKFKTYPLYTD